MPITPEHVGRRYPPTRPFPVTAVKVAEFTAALGGVADSDDPTVPATFAFAVLEDAWAQLFADPELGLAVERILHGDQRFDYDRPVRVGDQISGVTTIEQVRIRGAAEFITVSVELRAGTEQIGTERIGTERIGTATATFVHNRPEAAVA